MVFQVIGSMHSIIDAENLIYQHQVKVRPILHLWRISTVTTIQRNTLRLG